MKWLLLYKDLNNNFRIRKYSVGVMHQIKKLCEPEAIDLSAKKTLDAGTAITSQPGPSLDPSPPLAAVAMDKMELLAAAAAVSPPSDADKQNSASPRL